MRKILFVLLIFAGMLTESFAQDPQFSQYYAAPLYLNPAFTGASGQGRAGLNYRNQWPSIDANFTTYSAYADYYFDDFNSGLGLLILHDEVADVGMNQTQIGLNYAYQLRLSETFTFRPGVEAQYVLQSLNFSDLRFADQYNGSDFELPTNEDLGGGDNIGYFNLAFGGLLYSENFWIGGAVHNLTEPNQSYVSGDNPRLRRISVHGGYRFPLPAGPGYKGRNRDGLERTITPTFQYKMQGDFDQLDAGVYATLEPVVIGIWYRGLPFKPLNDQANNESVVLLVGFTSDNLQIGYSFDYTVSRLGIASGGAHEISLTYLFNLADPRRPPKNVRQIPCPRF
ncbi:type IX secretion system membrane protein PorP/SprF [Roseivirga sp. BDSF3-8]|uniref:PorP/SprF family type IX secretion system membrane protein n=1 Tax=Roseivirga sp. BDSF3-8 TaxID=3241598 RepID=UPI003531AC3E